MIIDVSSGNHSTKPCHFLFVFETFSFINDEERERRFRGMNGESNILLFQLIVKRFKMRCLVKEA